MVQFCGEDVRVLSSVEICYDDEDATESGYEGDCEPIVFDDPKKSRQWARP